MLNRDSGKTRVYGILLGVELEDNVCTPEQAVRKLADSLSFVEGVGAVTIDVLGEVDQYDEPEVETTDGA